jgi:hypothetical protein
LEAANIKDDKFPIVMKEFLSKYEIGISLIEDFQKKSEIAIIETSVLYGDPKIVESPIEFFKGVDEILKYENESHAANVAAIEKEKKKKLKEEQKLLRSAPSSRPPSAPSSAPSSRSTSPVLGSQKSLKKKNGDEGIDEDDLRSGALLRKKIQKKKKKVQLTGVEDLL